MNIQEKYDLDKKIIECTMCNCCYLEANDNKKYYMGYGKLLSKCGKTSNDLMIVGLNPSHVRWQGLMFHFGGGYKTNINSKYDLNAGYKFLMILKVLDVLNKTYITNLVKCSTANNQVAQTTIDLCFEIFKQEFNIVKPKMILALGSQVYNFLNSKNIKNLEHIYHPSYVFSYHGCSIEKYILNIKNILERNNII